MNLLSKTLFLFLDFVFIKLLGENKGIQISENIKKKPRNAYLASIFLLLGTVYYFFGDYIKKFFISKPTIEFVSKNENTLKVLILPFKNYDNSSLKVAESVTDRLKEKIENEKINLEVIYDSLATPTTLYKEAENIALNKDPIPDLILFGEYESNNYKLKLLNLTKDTINSFFIYDFLPKKNSSKYIKNSSSERIKNSNEISDQEYLIYKILFITALKNNDCDEANKIINSIVKIINESDNKQNIKEELDEFANNLSLCYYKNNRIDDALRIINWNLKNFPKSSDARMFKVSLLMNNLYLFENKDSLLNEMHNELNIVKRLDTDLESIPYLFSSYLYFLSDNYKEGIQEIESAKAIERRDSIFPVSSFVINLLKGDFNKNKELFDSIKNEYDIDSDIGNEIFYLVHNILDGNINDAVKNMSFIENYEYPSNFTDDENLEYFISIRDNMVDNFNINIDSTYNSLHHTYSNKAEKEFRNALMLALLMRNQNDIKYINKHLKKIIDINPDNGKYFNFNKLPKDSVITLKMNIYRFKDSIAFNPYNYKILSFLANNYKKLGYSFISNYYSHKAIDINLKSLLYLDNSKFLQNNDSLKNVFLNYVSVLNNNPESANDKTYEFLAYILKKYNYIDYSRYFYQNAIAYNPKNAYLYSDIGWLEIDSKHYNEALYYFNKQYQIEPKSFSSVYNLFSVYYFLKQWKLSKKYLDLSIKRYNSKIYYTSIKKLNKHKEYVDKMINNT